MCMCVKCVSVGWSVCMCVKCVSVGWGCVYVCEVCECGVWVCVCVGAPVCLP